MSNNNCLQGMKCPSCGNEDSFRIACQVWCDVSDEGTGDTYDYEWDDESSCVCPECMKVGCVGDFKEKAE